MCKTDVCSFELEVDADDEEKNGQESSCIYTKRGRKRLHAALS
jgi:hypothetical protein